mmetsp:Transcript_21584/g.55545  ORF Transcript_21584/g.55545 Transcript_21584/m.55545 type:complete len:306 (+) Transcript_21584:713-1630(+)
MPSRRTRGARARASERRAAAAATAARGERWSARAPEGFGAAATVHRRRLCRRPHGLRHRHRLPERRAHVAAALRADAACHRARAAQMRWARRAERRERRLERARSARRARWGRPCSAWWRGARCWRGPRVGGAAHRRMALAAARGRRAAVTGGGHGGFRARGIDSTMAASGHAAAAGVCGQLKGPARAPAGRVRAGGGVVAHEARRVRRARRAQPVLGGGVGGRTRAHSARLVRALGATAARDVAGCGRARVGDRHAGLRRAPRAKRRMSRWGRARRARHSGAVLEHARARWRYRRRRGRVGDRD